MPALAMTMSSRPNRETASPTAFSRGVRIPDICFVRADSPAQFLDQPGCLTQVVCPEFE
jgi:hypothetical protein